MAAWDDLWTSWLCFWLGLEYEATGRTDEAKEYAERALALSKRLGWPPSLEDALDLGTAIALEAGELDQAEELATELLGTAEAIGEYQGVIRARFYLEGGRTVAWRLPACRRAPPETA